MDLKQYGITQESFQMVCDYIDEVKELLSSELWGNIFLDCSKNEVLVLWLLFLKDEVNMSEIAEYIHVPLNTATGIVSRMEKSGLVERTRSDEDKRVVLIRFGDKGRTHFNSLLNEMMRYGTKIFSSFTKEEIELFVKMTGKVKEVLKEEKQKEAAPKKVRKITIE
ncbi:MAG: MarR family transcriptional regulator [Eubacterium sp.]|nr:MarR family transcriptional regulator [Eubacterium sp.]